MTTHVENKQPNTLIKDSTISVGTLNVNKTSTDEAIAALLPEYYLLDASSHTGYVFDLNPSVNLDLTSLFKVFIDGQLVETAPTLNDDGVFLYPLGTQFKINGASYTSLIDQNATIHALYTSI